MRKMFNITYKALFCLLTASLPLMADECTPACTSDHILAGTRPMPHSEWLQIQEERAQQDVEHEEKILIAKKTNATAFQSKLSCPQASISYYTHAGTYHHPYIVSALGDQVELEDGSNWAIHVGDRYKTFNWLTSDEILITPNHAWFSSYMFCLLNKNTGTSVQANLTLGPIYNGPVTHWILAIDYFSEEVCLEDGSIWKVSGFDSSTFNRWMVNDTIIIGVNDGFLHSTKPNILINVNNLAYVRACCTY